MPYKEILSSIAILITIISFFPYIRSILSGKTKPHVISWVIWGLLTIIVFFAQLADNGGAGAWPIGVSGMITIYIAALAFLKRADVEITRTDWVFLLMAVSALPLWYFTASPLSAVVILTAVELIGFIPTFKKSYVRPYEEQLTFFVLMMIRNFISIGALENYSVTTVLFPAVAGGACLIFIAVVLQRRKVIQA